MNIFTTSLAFIEVPNKISLAIFTVGCEHNCKGCSNKALNEMPNPSMFKCSEEDFLKNVSNSIGLIDGICWLGGDPLYQEEEFLKYIKTTKQNYPLLFNCLYTGYQFEKINNEVKEYVDFIIDGKWTGKVLSDPETNQRIFKKENNNWKKIDYKIFKGE